MSSGTTFTTLYPRKGGDDMMRRVKSDDLRKFLQAVAMLALVAVIFQWLPSFMLLLLAAGFAFALEMVRLVRRYGCTSRVQLEFIVVTFGLFAAFEMRLYSFTWAAAVGLCVIASDSMANVFGKLIGGRLIKRPFSDYSPKKTWEGTAIGVGAGVIVFVLVAQQAFQYDRVALATAGLLVAEVAVWGDLQQSRMKRELDVKDVSGSLGAHGGFSERLDSMSRGYLMGAVLLLAYAI